MALRSREEDEKHQEFVQIGVLEAEFDTCRKQLFSELQKAHDRIADLDKEVNKKRDIIIGLRREVTEQKDDFAKNIASKNERIADLDKEVALQNIIIVHLGEEVTKQKDDFAKHIASKDERFRALDVELSRIVTEKDKLKQENDTLKVKSDKKIEYLQTFNSELEKNNERLNDHIKKLDIDMKNLSCKGKKETEQLENDLNETKHANTELMYQMNTLETEKRKLGEIVKTLNAEVKNLKFTHDLLEKSDENRPRKLAETLWELYNNEWTDAFEVLPFEKDEQKPKYLINILLEAGRLCSDLLSRHGKMIKDNLRILTAEIEINRRGRKLSVKEKDNNFTQSESVTPCEEMTIESDFDLLSKEQKRAIMEAKNIFECLLTNEVETTVTHIIGTSHQMKMKRQDLLETYIKKCVNICWLMCRHNPPVFLEFSDAKENMLFDKNKYKHYTRSGKYIDHIVWPAVHLHEGGPLLCKGVAQGMEQNKHNKLCKWFV